MVDNLISLAQLLQDYKALRFLVRKSCIFFWPSGSIRAPYHHNQSPRVRCFLRQILNLSPPSRRQQEQACLNPGLRNSNKILNHFIGAVVAFPAHSGSPWPLASKADVISLQAKCFAGTFPACQVCPPPCLV